VRDLVIGDETGIVNLRLVGD